MKIFAIDHRALVSRRERHRGFGAASLLGSLMVLGNASAASAPVWQGQFFVDAVTSQCAPSASVGDFGTAIYAPQLAPGPQTRGDSLAMFFSRFTVAIGVDRNKPSRSGTDGSLRGENPIVAQSVSSHAMGESRVSFSYLLIYPQSITADTREVVVKGAVNSFFSMPGCVLGFKANLLLQP